MRTDDMSHWWAHDARYTYCDLPTVGRVLSTHPTCPVCAERLETTAQAIAALEQKTPREYRLEAEAFQLAPLLYAAVLRILGQQDPMRFDTTPTQTQEDWYDMTMGMLEVFTTHPKITASTTLKDVVEHWTAQQLRLVKGGKA